MGSQAKHEQQTNNEIREGCLSVEQARLRAALSAGKGTSPT